ncbi:MAG: hypothetical protein ABW106_04640 [Steroidobacteraceae bacterium]
MIARHTTVLRIAALKHDDSAVRRWDEEFEYFGIRRCDDLAGLSWPWEDRGTRSNRRSRAGDAPLQEMVGELATPLS